jgi:hypothetical protein
MSGRTLVMMALVLGLNWGGFVFCLWYGSRGGRA